MCNKETDQFVMQGVAMANNYFHTGRPNKAIEMLLAVKSIDADNNLAELMMQKICCDQFRIQPPNLSEHFGLNWLGENLDGKSIQIFCDQGMGDTINLLRYVQLLKKEYDCKIILNYYAFFNQFERILQNQEYIDFFTPFHVKCDYHTNIMSLPAILNGIELYVYYPANFEIILNTPLPNQVNFGQLSGKKLEGKTKIGIVWQTNADNPLSEQKSIELNELNNLSSIDANFYCLQPLKFESNWIQSLPIEDLHDTASFITSCDYVISVDTAVLHLAGVLGVKTFALIPFDSDPRWEKSNLTKWYPSVELFRQNEDLDWSKPIDQIKNKIYELI